MSRCGKYMLMLALLSVLAHSARNQESKVTELLTEGPLRVNSVYVDTQGVKWFGTNRGLLRFDGNSRRYFTTADGLTGNLITSLDAEATTPSGDLWLATEGGVTAVISENNGISVLRTLGSGDGLLDDSVTSAVVDERARKFFGSASGITWIHGDTMGYLTYSVFNASMVNAPVRQMEVFNDTLYVAQEGGIGRFVSGVDGVSGASRWTSEYGMSPLSGNIMSVLVDSRGHQWFGTDMGVQEHAGQKAKENWVLYTTAEGLVENHVISIAEDQDGGIWFGTFGGVSWLKEGEWTSFTTSKGLLNDTVLDIGIDQEGTLWLATASGVCSYRDGTFSDHYTPVRPYRVPGQGMQVYFSPEDRSVHVSYTIVRATEVSARLYSLDGKLVGMWQDLPSRPGRQQAVLPLSDLKTRNSGGIYVLELLGGAWPWSKKLVIAD